MTDSVEPQQTATIRPSTPGDLPEVYRMVQEAIADSPFYCQAFKDFEAARLSQAYIAALAAADPAYAMMVYGPDGQLAGTILSSPEMGAIFQLWSYLKPEHRKGSLATRAMRLYVAHWDQGRFHKISTYTRPENRVAQLLMTRNGYRQAAVLQNHIFGEDYQLWERPLTKVTPGYDLPVAVGLKGRLAARARAILGGGSQ